MVRLYKIKDELYWVVCDKRKYVCNSLKEVLECASSYDISLSEIEEAIVDMGEKDNNVSFFGINKTFIYSDRINYIKGE